MNAARFKARREEMGLTQVDLGKRLGIDPQAVYRYEKGQSDPSGDMLGRMATALEVSSDWLLGLVENQRDILSEEGLDPIERKLIDCLRKGRLIEAMQALAELAQKYKEAKIARNQPPANDQLF